MAHTWRPRPKGGTFCRLKSKRVGISLVVVYERVGKAVQSVKGPKRADRKNFVAVRETRKLPGLVSAPLTLSEVRVGIGQCSLLSKNKAAVYLIRERKYSVSVGFL